MRLSAPFGIAAIELGNELGVWQVPISWTAAIFVPVFILCFSVSAAPIICYMAYRASIRLAGIIVSLAVVATIGPPRDYMYAWMFPEWMVFAPGIAPVIAHAFDRSRYRPDRSCRHAADRGSIGQEPLSAQDQD